LGCGTVGGGVYQRLSDLTDMFEVSGVVNLDPAKALANGIDPLHLARDARSAIGAPCDVVIELIGGIEPARTYVEYALRLGRHVVTANKALLAEHGIELSQLAAEHGVMLRYGASVGGVLPALEAVAQAGESATAITGIINGTCNFIFDQLADGADLESAIKLARDEGFAEADPTLDLDGTDAAQKLILLARETFGVSLPLQSIERRGLDLISPAAVLAAGKRGNAYRLIADCRVTPDGIRATVRPVEVSGTNRFAQIKGADNCLVITHANGCEKVLRGRGAGRYATTEAVMADLFDVRSAINGAAKYRGVAA
jgi:homoserine dehydrogenase